MDFNIILERSKGAKFKASRPPKSGRRKTEPEFKSAEEEKFQSIDKGSDKKAVTVLQQKYRPYIKITKPTETNKLEAEIEKMTNYTIALVAGYKDDGTAVGIYYDVRLPELTDEQSEDLYLQLDNISKKIRERNGLDINPIRVTNTKTGSETQPINKNDADVKSNIVKALENLSGSKLLDVLDLVKQLSTYKAK